MKQIFLLFILKYTYICLTHFFINLKLLLKYFEINIRLAEANTTKGFIASLPTFQNFLFFYFIIEKLFVFLPPRSVLNNLLHSQFPSYIDASNSCFTASGDFFLVVFLVTLRSYKLRKVLSSMLLKHCKNVKHKPWKSVITSFNQPLMPGSVILSRKFS